MTIHKTIISVDPRITIKRRMYDTIIDLDMLKTGYNINEEGAKVIAYRLKESEPYLFKESKRYLEYIPCMSMNIKILDQYADELANFLLEVVTNEKYIEKRVYK